ncbi:uncharacterized protein LOC6040521 [Culex quinquefasciatus]|uniref:uncharacterized protein LOC6040521 n=1 Tax=Culex quinquefasciatus TaxID=7176 RepID=UPI0018E3ABAA|nr:uncharacterized protein LOC6040521 [Culex quinquefasciatus]
MEDISTGATLTGLELRWFLEMRRCWNADISVYRDFVARYDALISESAETVKDNSLAVHHRQLGNRAYLEKRFIDALWQYNRSICFAENLSEHLGIGYANRSAIYYEIEEYEFALYNIDLARKNHYPERLLPKLVAREANCKERIAGGHSKGTVPHSFLDINVEVNPKISFLAKGIGMKRYEKMGRGLVAERDFDIGDVILDEKSELCFVSFGRSFFSCCHCGSMFEKSLIPCPSCVAVMYCGEKCREEDFRTTHRFECCVITKLWSVTVNNMMAMARLFFYGLTAFNDDVTEMMKYCMANAAVGSNPLELDLTKPNPLDVFKVLHQFKPNPGQGSSDLDHSLKLHAATFYSIFMKNPLVQSIIRTKAQRNFMLHCLLIHGRVAKSLLLNQGNESEGCQGIFSPIASLLNHSCDPNVTAQIDSGSIKVIVLRPIRKGDQICTSCASAWWDDNGGTKFDFQCMCVVCDQGPEGAKWRKARNKVRPISRKAARELEDIALEGLETHELLMMQRMVKTLVRDGHYPGELFGETMLDYYNTLYEVLRSENAKLNRAKALQCVPNSV